MKIIDFHNHYYPPAYIEALKSERSDVTVTEDSEGNPVLHSPGDTNIAVRGHRDIEFRRDVLKEEGVDMQVLTLTAPGTLAHAPERSAHYSSVVNDELASIVRDNGDHFSALATLPLNNPDASVDELERVIEQLGFGGCMLFSNANGVALSDESFWPLYERAGELGAVFYIHPTYPVGVEAMTEYWLMPLVGFTFDTTLAAAGLVFSGVVERFPGITWVLAHLGGAIPYLAERLDRGYRAFEDCRRNITRLPSDQLREFCYDTVNFDVGALSLAIDFAGVDHILAGSDYPHQIGSLSSMVASIEELDISDVDRAAILGGNAARLLRL